MRRIRPFRIWPTSSASGVRIAALSPVVYRHAIAAIYRATGQQRSTVTTVVPMSRDWSSAE